MLTRGVGAGPAPYLVMEDVTHGYGPWACVADVKLGTRTYDPFATAAKAAHEAGKYAWQGELGFRITGMLVAAPGRDPVRFDRFYGRQLAPAAVPAALSQFFLLDQGDRAYGREVVALVAGEVAALRAWMASQRALRFYGASLLIAYAGGPPPPPAPPPPPRVRLIDFAHVYPWDATTHDDGCVHGLLTLQRYLHGLL
jgi:inositol-polyphosphate multikinase